MSDWNQSNQVPLLSLLNSDNESIGILFFGLFKHTNQIIKHINGLKFTIHYYELKNLWDVIISYIFLLSSLHLS